MSSTAVTDKNTTELVYPVFTLQTGTDSLSFLVRIE